MDVINRILETMVPVLIIVAIGAAYSRYKKPDMRVPNTLNMDLFVPLLIFSAFSDAEFDLMAYTDLAIGGVLVILGSGLLVWPIGKLLGYDARTFVPPAMFTNTGNLGLPLVFLAFGEAGMPAIVVLFVIEMVMHFTLGFYILDRKARVLNGLSIPTLIATAAALAVNLLDLKIPTMLDTGLDFLADICIPLMLFALGVRMATVKWNDLPIALWCSVLTPLSGLVLVYALQPILQLDAMQLSVFILFGALPPAVLNFMVAERYNQEPAKVASMVLISNMTTVGVMPLALLLAPAF